MDLVQRLKEIEKELLYKGSLDEVKVIKQAIISLSYNEKNPTGIEIVPVNKISYEVKDDSLLPCRVVDEYCTLDGIPIGTVDSLYQFSLIND